MEGIARIGPAVGHAVVGWVACAGVMGVGRAVTTMERTLLIHAAAVPVVFGALAWSYFQRVGHLGAVRTAALFTGTVIALDAGLVAPVFEHSFAMFRSVRGTWLPFGLIFLVTWIAGRRIGARPGP
jgi:hypothetical protein